ncbi:hypothetical protein [Bacillus halotolerans]|uniref:hypothetical protein n=1 Tax=Bacillus halotolerans TaxID=260554 RepID=UPI00178CC103|nr:hypothetical protein [Bacillus halotolerans]
MSKNRHHFAYLSALKWCFADNASPSPEVCSSRSTPSEDIYSSAFAAITERKKLLAGSSFFEKPFSPQD